MIPRKYVKLSLKPHCQIAKLRWQPRSTVSNPEYFCSVLYCLGRAAWSLISPNTFLVHNHNIYSSSQVAFYKWKYNVSVLGFKICVLPSEENESRSFMSIFLQAPELGAAILKWKIREKCNKLRKDNKDVFEKVCLLNY